MNQPQTLSGYVAKAMVDLGLTEEEATGATDYVQSHSTTESLGVALSDDLSTFPPVISGNAKQNVKRLIYLYLTESHPDHQAIRILSGL